MIAGIILLQGAYLLCVGPYRDRFRDATPVPGSRQLLFAEGVAVLLLALVSPLHEWSDHYLFSAHMVQHLLMVLGAVPLLLAGTPGWLLLAMLRASRTLALVQRLRHPLAAFGAFNLVFALAHLPSIYEMTLASDLVHAVVHLLFLTTAVVMWLGVLSPLPEALPRYPPLGQILYLFLQTVPQGLVGALLASSSFAFYPTYLSAPRVLGLTPLVDQQIGGFIMWIGASVYFLVAAAIVFFRWAALEERDASLGRGLISEAGPARNRISL